MTDTKKAVIFGAGKTGRGFLAHLLVRAGISVVFVEQNKSLVQLMAQNKRYSIHFKDRPELTQWITDFSIYHLQSQRSEVIKTLADADFVMTAVGGNHLQELVEPLLEGMEQSEASKKWFIITAENWHQPALELQQGLLKSGRDHLLQQRLHCADATVLRTVVDFRHSEDPLALLAQDYWILQVNGDAISKNELPDIPSFEFVKGFQGALQRKIYTYNAASAAVCYLGCRLHWDDYGKSARHPVVEAIIRQIFEEIEGPLCSRFGFSPEEQRSYASKALEKFQDPAIHDTNYRNAQDPIRKLGRYDRITGPGLMVLEYGQMRPMALAFVAAAALRTQLPQDPVSVRLQEMRKRKGDAKILAEIIDGLSVDHPWIAMIIEAGSYLDRAADLESAWREWLGGNQEG